MKTLIKITTVLMLAMTISHGDAQTLSICAGSSAIVSAVNSAGLSNPSYSLNPGGLTSSTPTFVVAPPFKTTYTLFVTGTNSNSAVVTTSNTVTVKVDGVTFSLTSPGAFNLGCGSKSICTVNIANAGSAWMTSGGPVFTGAPISYTFVPPGSSTILPPTGTLSSASTITLNTTGTWSVAVRDNSNFCTGWDTMNITVNTVSPAISGMLVSQNMLTCSNPTTAVQIAPNSTVQYQWFPSGTLGNSIDIPTSIPPNSTTPTPGTYPLAPPTQSIATTLTLVVTDNYNGCESTTLIPVYQNRYEPNAAISGGLPGICQNTVVLTNVSSSGIPASLFPSPLAVVATLWEGPAPQPTAALSTTYLAQTVGIYTMTVMDMNNGCTKTTTYNVSAGPAAAFVHTITNGQAIFNDISTGTDTNTAYFWDFGDGNTSTQQNPTHTYSSGGAHLVKLKVTDGILLCSDSVIQSVNVSGIPCVANSGFSMAPTSTAQLWSIVPDYPWNITAATWNWGDGSSSNTLYTSHQYSAAALYNICLSVTVSCVASSSTCTSYSVYRTTQSALMYEVQVMAPQLISGLNTSEADAQFSWNIVPNPNAGSFMLTLNNTVSETVNVVIRDLTGRTLQQHAFEGRPSLIFVPAGNLPAGMYLVSLETDYLKITKRMVVHH